MSYKEKKTPSDSGILFGHYIAGAQSYIILRYHALKTAIALKRGFALDHWSRFFSVIFKKKPGVTFIETIRPTLLMEANSNI